MKKFIISLMAVGVICAISIPILAEDPPKTTDITTNDGQGTTTVSLNMNSTFTIRIPDTVEIKYSNGGAAGMESDPADITLAAGAKLLAGHKLQVKADSATVTLEGTTDPSITVTAKIQTDKVTPNTYVDVTTPDNVVFEVDSDTVDETTQHIKYVTTTTKVTHAQNYEGTTIFTAKLVSPTTP